MERSHQPPGQQQADEAAEQVPHARDPGRLMGLITEARLAPSGEQPRLASEINALLEAMRAPGNETAEARAVLEQLELNGLDALVDTAGKSCRAEAVETLLACGFPHALAVRPEDLAHHAEQQAPRAKGANPLIVAGALVAGLVLVAGLFNLAPRDAKAAPAVLLYVLILVGSSLLGGKKRRGDKEDL